VSVEGDDSLGGGDTIPVGPEGYMQYVGSGWGGDTGSAEDVEVVT